ncbi:MAG: helix-turn-helix transcriptional regulator [Mycobacteriales bacterium]
MDIATFLKDTRAAANVSLPELAGRAGLSPGMLTSYERGSRSPRVDQVDQILAGLGLQIRFEAEPLWAEVDAAIDAAGAMDPVERLSGLAVRPLGLLAELADIPCVLEGMCAAVLLGAPVPAAVIDLVLPRDDEVLERFHQWAALRAHRWSDKWRRFGFAVPDPREGRDPLRYETEHGELRLRLADPLPDSIEVTVGDQTIRVLDLRAVEPTDAVSGRVLQRIQQRLASQA